MILPATSAQFGRASKPRSHRLYRSPGAQTRKFIDPVRRSMLVEIRSDGGLQTVFPPSVHPSGETIEWAAEDDPAETPAKCLSTAVGRPRRRRSGYALPAGRRGAGQVHAF